MTASTTNTNFARRADHGLRDAVTRFFTGVGAGYSAYLAYNSLSRMSDRQLADIGLSRTDVPRAAATGLLDR